MTLHLESGSTGQIENAKGNTPRGTIRIDISTHRIVLYSTRETYNKSKSGPTRQHRKHYVYDDYDNNRTRDCSRENRNTV